MHAFANEGGVAGVRPAASSSSLSWGARFAAATYCSGSMRYWDPRRRPLKVFGSNAVFAISLRTIFTGRTVRGEIAERPMLQ